MKNQFYIIAMVLVIIWGVGFFALGANSIIHILLIIALISSVLGILQEQN